VPINVHALGGDGGQEAAEVHQGGGPTAAARFASSTRSKPRSKRRSRSSHQDLRRRRGRLPARGRGQDQALHRPGSRQAATLHGQDASVAVARPSAQGRPRGFRVPIRDIRPATRTRATFYPLLGEMRTMPGLAKRPAGRRCRQVDTETRPHQGPVLERPHKQAAATGAAAAHQRQAPPSRVSCGRVVRRQRARRGAR